MSLAMNVEHNWWVQWVMVRTLLLTSFSSCLVFSLGIHLLYSQGHQPNWNLETNQKVALRLYRRTTNVLYVFSVFSSLGFILLVFVGLTDLINPGPLHFLYESNISVLAENIGGQIALN